MGAILALAAPVRGCMLVQDSMLVRGSLLVQDSACASSLDSGT